MATSMICPQCGRPMHSADGVTAACPVHGAKFQILACRLDATSPIPPKMAALAPAPPGLFCVQHPAVAAIGACDTCGACFCATCHFELPGNIHLCPACATTSDTKLSPKRKRAMIISIVLAVWCTLALAVIFSGSLAPMLRTPEGKQALGLAFTFLVLVPSIVGLSYSLGSIERRLPNPPALWVGTIWNGIILAVFLLLCLVGVMKRS